MMLSLMLYYFDNSFQLIQVKGSTKAGGMLEKCQESGLDTYLHFNSNFPKI